MSKANRDKAWLEGGKRGQRGSLRNQLCHPMYVEDYTQVTGETLTKADCGFGNDIYRTHFKAIYTLAQ